ncbi:multidrug efflux SMR transporter [Castellaniella ginsengisoli]|uniref:Spermidine export protein MdtJ n=1 Tax=Castellaniella ginsengisoli TaxID=546114 RepID=A0AB39D811_9BURK
MPLRPWLFLLAAVAVEVLGVTLMKRASGSGAWMPLLFMYAMIGLSFYFLALAVKRLPMALAYAAWETLGLVCVTFIGLRYFGESLSPARVLGLAVLLAGVVLVNLGAPRAQAA